jgi:protein-disulfide isomerase
MIQNHRGITDLIVSVCAIAITGLAARREFLMGHEPPPVALRAIANWHEVLDGGHLVYGPADAPVKVIEFGDFECRSCAEATKELRQLADRHPNLIAVIYRHYPLRELHQHAYLAAVASECAAIQGAFRTYHDLLFKDQQSIGRVRWTDFAARARVADTIRFRNCLGEVLARERVARDTDLAYRLGVRMTPTFVLNGNVLLGSSPTREQWDWLVTALAAKASVPPIAKR